MKYDINFFIEIANLRHNNKYDYSITNYISMRSSVDIICPEHGVFNQNAGTHVSRSGCPECKGVKRLTNEEFINKCNKIHNFKYDYSKVVFKNTISKIDIICPEHGLFVQIAQNHYRSGCPSCMNVKKITIEYFIYICNNIHKNKYDYSNITEIKNNDSYVDIICPKHGEFNQRISSHLRGNGCKSCAMACKTSNIETKWLDSIGIDPKYRQYKIEKFIVDGFNPNTNTVYEFNGDYWHGNPNKYDPNKLNNMLEKTFGELYSNTLKKENILKQLGYKVISIWESDYKNQSIKL